MNYTLEVPTCLDATFAQTAVTLWKNIFNTSFDVDDNTFSKLWPKVTHEISNQVEFLTMPYFLKPNLHQFVEYIERQLRDWTIKLIDHVFGRYFNTHLAQQIIECSHWTVNGRLVMAESAKNLCRSNDLSLTHKFEIAYVFCIPDEIDRIWTNCKDCSEEYIEENKRVESELKNLTFKYWKNHLLVDNSNETNEEDKHDLFIACVDFRIQSGVEYFWSQMTEFEKTEFFRDKRNIGSLVQTIMSDLCRHTDRLHPRGDGDSFSTSILCFLLSEMTRQQLDAILVSQIGPKIFLPLIVDFLYVECFVPTLNFNLSAIADDCLLTIVVSLIRVSFWRASLHKIKVKDCLIDLLIDLSFEQRSRVCQRVLEYMFAVLFRVVAVSHQDLIIIELLLRDLSVENRTEVLSRGVLRERMDRCKLNLGFLMSVANRFITSKDELLVFKENCSLRVPSVRADASVYFENQRPDVVDRFLQFCSLKK